MPLIDAVVQCPIYDSFRVQQVAGMFDVPLADKCTERFSVELPDEAEEWDIGIIVGSSGSGKTTIARQAYADSIYSGENWDHDKAIIDCFGDRSIKQTTKMLTAVGISSPPSWVKPYRVLSNGEKFRCDLARALSSEKPLVVYDEFTSVVDRTVAKIGSAAVSKAIRKTNKRFVAVSCHYDIVQWLEPDWVLDMSTCELTRGRLRRPEINLEIFRCHHSAWRLFAKHHYLDAKLNRSAVCYLGVIDEMPVTFCAFLSHMACKNMRRISRIVTLPDYQGVGIGSEMIKQTAKIMKDRGHRVVITTSHPAMIAHMRSVEHWRITRVMKQGGPKTSRQSGPYSILYKSSAGRSVVSAEFVA